MSTDHLDPLGALDAAFARAAERPRFLAGSDSTPAAEAQRLAASFATIEAEIDAPKAGVLARLLARVGVDEGTIPLVTATPGLRRSWIGAVAVAVFFALNAANTSTADGVDRILIFLTLAPLVPLVGVALAFGPKVDPTHEIAVAAPMDGFRLFLVRSLTVVGASSLLLLIGSGFAPAGGAQRIAWLLPALAATTVTMALSTRLDPRAAAATVGVTWIGLVTIGVQATDAATVFGPGVQIVSLAIAASGAFVFSRQRRRLDTLSER